MGTVKPDLNWHIDLFFLLWTSLWFFEKRGNRWVYPWKAPMDAATCRLDLVYMDLVRLEKAERSQGICEIL